MKSSKALLLFLIIALMNNCGGGSGGGSGASSGGGNPSPPSPPAQVNNVLSITVNGSLCSATNSYPNKPCVSVTICTPGTSSCQTMNDILLDTGSSGLRIFKQSLTVSLPQVSGNAGLAECIQYGGRLVGLGAYSDGQSYSRERACCSGPDSGDRLNFWHTPRCMPGRGSKSNWRRI